MGRQKRSLGCIVDVVVASPGRLLKHRNAGNVFLSSVEHIVIDEVCCYIHLCCAYLGGRSRLEVVVFIVFDMHVVPDPYQHYLI